MAFNIGFDEIMKSCPNCGFVQRAMDKFTYEQFSLFWTKYPRKVGKGAAEKVWSKMKGNEELFTKILTAVDNQKNGEAWQKDNGVYIPHPATWLNQRRWEDEVVVKWKDPYKSNNDPEKMEAAKSRLDAIREREIQRIHGGRDV